MNQSSWPPRWLTPVPQSQQDAGDGDIYAKFAEAVCAFANDLPGHGKPGLLVIGVDNRGIDGIVNGLAAFVGGSGERLRRWQTGFARSYALAMVGGAVLVVVVLAVVRLP